MMRTFLCCLPYFCAMLGMYCAEPSLASESAVHAHARESLTAQAGDPTAPIIQAQVTWLYSDVLRDSSDDLQQLLIEPVIPTPPNKLISMTQIIRPTIPWLDTPDGRSGMGDIDIQHIFIPGHHDWGTLGFGYTATLIRRITRNWVPANTRPDRQRP